MNTAEAVKQSRLVEDKIHELMFTDGFGYDEVLMPDNLEAYCKFIFGRTSKTGQLRIKDAVNRLLKRVLDEAKFS